MAFLGLFPGSVTQVGNPLPLLLFYRDNFWKSGVELLQGFKGVAQPDSTGDFRGTKKILLLGTFLTENWLGSRQNLTW